jgi:hypothetical protein
MDIEKTILPPEAFQEVCLMKRRIEFLESSFTMECLENPDLMMHLKEMYLDVDTDLHTFCEKLASIQNDAMPNSNSTVV